MNRGSTVTIGLLSCLSVALLAAMSLAHASMAYVPQPMEKAILAAEIVAQVRITSITTTPCGTDYTVEVLKRYKGKSERALTFASRRSPISNRDREVSKDDTLLVLLSTRSLAQAPYDSSCCSDAPSPPPPKAELQCRAKLASYTPLVDFESSFLLEKRTDKAGGTPAVWLWYDRLRTELPTNIESQDTRQPASRGPCTGPSCRARWKVLERRVQEWTRTSADATRK